MKNSDGNGGQWWLMETFLGFTPKILHLKHIRLGVI